MGYTKVPLRCRLSVSNKHDSRYGQSYSQIDIEVDLRMYNWIIKNSNVTELQGLRFKEEKSYLRLDAVKNVFLLKNEQFQRDLDYHIESRTRKNRRNR